MSICARQKLTCAGSILLTCRCNGTLGLKHKCLLCTDRSKCKIDNKHSWRTRICLLFGPTNLRINEPSEQWTFGTMNLRNNGPSEQKTFGTPGSPPVKDGLKKYCDVIYSHSGINQMWILKKSKELLNNFNSNSLASVNSIKTYDFSTLYTNIPHTKLKSRLAELIRNAFQFKNGKKRYEYIVVGYKSTYFVKDHSEAKISTQKTLRVANDILPNLSVSPTGILMMCCPTTIPSLGITSMIYILQS